MGQGRRISDRLASLQFEHDLTCNRWAASAPLPGYDRSGVLPELASRVHNFFPIGATVALLLLWSLVNGLTLVNPDVPLVSRALHDDVFFLRTSDTDAAQYLPNAPEEWARVTDDDALRPGILHDLSTSWPGGSSALEAHPGFPALLAHLDMCIENGPRQDPVALRTASALYLHPDGSVIGARVAVRDAGDHLGRSRHRDGWMTKLATEEAQSLRPDQYLQWLTLAGQPAIHTVEPGKTLPVSPHGPTDIDLALALTNRVVLRLDGSAPMRSIREMIRAATAEPRE